MSAKICHTIFEQRNNNISCLKCRRQHVGKQFQSEGEQEFHKGNDNKDHERHQSEDILRRPSQMKPLSTS